MTVLWLRSYREQLLSLHPCGLSPWAHSTLSFQLSHPFQTHLSLMLKPHVPSFKLPTCMWEPPCNVYKCDIKTGAKAHTLVLAQRPCLVSHWLLSLGARREVLVDAGVSTGCRVWGVGYLVSHLGWAMLCHMPGRRVTCLLSAAIESCTFAVGGATAHGGRVSNCIQGQVWHKRIAWMLMLYAVHPALLKQMHFGHA